jgi:pimeloyl-ACP methyl ester carboxylesterase
VSGPIDGSTMDAVRQQVRQAMEEKAAGIDLVLHTSGGSTSASVGILDFLMEFNGEISTWVPTYAHSMGTFLALNLLARGPVTLAPLSTLSPMDPQFGAYCRRNIDHVLASDPLKKVVTEELLLSDANLRAEGARLRAVSDRLFLTRVPSRRRAAIVSQFIDTSHNHNNLFTAESARKLGIPVLIGPVPPHLAAAIS